MELENLDEETRTHMLAELDLDVAGGRVYASTRLIAGSFCDYTDALRAALAAGTPSAFERAIAGLLALEESDARGRIRRVPWNAAQTLAFGQFNYYYVRGVCVRAIAEHRRLEVYRTQPVREPRPHSEALIGTSPDAEVLLEELRTAGGFAPLLGVPGGPGSKISVRLREAFDE